MICKALVVSGPGDFCYKDFDIGESIDGEVSVKVIFSSICKTDHHVVDGSLVYYKSGEANYPIITGHEWVGDLNGTPVVGLCILSSAGNRVEVGVVNKHGGHAQCVHMPRSALLEVPALEYKYALIEPLAVAIRGFKRLKVNKEDRILINGFGSIGRMFGRVLDYHNLKYDIYDIDICGNEPNWCDYNIIAECSGSSGVLGKFLECKGSKILLYGLNYDLLNINECVSNEIDIVTSLGSYMDDFKLAVEIMKDLTINECDFYELKDFSKALQNKKKVILSHV